MGNQNEEAKKHIGETKAVDNHVHDLLHDLSNRVDAVWRYDQYIANAERAEAEDEVELWKDLKTREVQTVKTLKELLYKQLGKELK